MKIIFCSCLFLCLAAVYVQSDKSACVRTQGDCQRVHFDELDQTTTADGSIIYYRNCYLYKIWGSGCRHIRRCPIRGESCQPDSIQHIRPTLYCESVKTFNCRYLSWISVQHNVAVQHPIAAQYMYEYVPSCSCHHPDWIPKEVEVDEAKTKIDLRDCDGYEEFQMEENHAGSLDLKPPQPLPC